MIIDIHTHTFPDRIAARAIEKTGGKSHSVPFSDGTADGLVRTMGEAGIDISVILPVATDAGQVEKINNSAVVLNEKYREQGLVSFGAMHPDYGNIREELSRIKEMGLLGIKLHPMYQGADLCDIRYLRIFSRAAELGLVVITHAGLDIGYPGVVRCSPGMARQVIREIGDFPFVLAHMGGWRNWDEVPEELADTHVLLDTAFSTGRIYSVPEDFRTEEESRLMDQDQFMVILQAFGPERLLFGTDSPWTAQKESIAFVRELPVSKEDKDKILGLNAAKLLGL